MAATLRPMQRMSVSFRFGSDLSLLDAQSLSSLGFLTRRLEQGILAPRRLLFVGFSDGEGSADTKRASALDRAEAVRSLFQSAFETPDTPGFATGVEAFGEAMPMACDDSPWGRRTNKRVEVWVR